MECLDKVPRTSGTHYRYKLLDFENIQFSYRNHTLPASVVKLIHNIAAQVSAPEYVKTPQFKKDKDKLSSSRGWRAEPPLKKTVFKKADGDDAIISKIRQHLNKLSDKTFDLLSEKIFSELNELVIHDNTEALSLIGEFIFTIASTNGFFSQLYAKFYKHLLEKIPSMESIFKKHFDTFGKLFVDISIADPVKDYDLFCEENKKKDQRCSIAKFYVNLMLLGVIKPNTLIDILQTIRIKINENIQNKENVLLIDELSELYKIISIEGKDVLFKSESCSTTSQKDFIKSMSKYDPINKPALSHKSVFKFMDITDAL